MQKLSPIAYFLLRDFGPILGETLRASLQTLLPFLNRHTDPQTPEEWAEFLIDTQISNEDPTPAFQWWDPEALCFTGPQKQEKTEPEVTLLDLILGEWTGQYSERALLDHPIQLQAGLIYPRAQAISLASQEKKWSRRFWGKGFPTHSALLHTQGTWIEEGNAIVIDLPSKEINDEVEVSYFLSRHASVHLSVREAKSTTFQLGEPLIVESAGEKFEIVFSSLEGDGRFWGHLYFGNRPRQISCRGALKYEAFDWQIALRTIQRAERCRIRIDFQSLMRITGNEFI